MTNPQPLAQIGFTIGMGLLLDTFVVRTLVVPAFATLLGPRVWWPSRSATVWPAGSEQPVGPARPGR